MYPLTTHLYNLKVGSGKTITNASGIAYTIKTQALLPRLNLSWGEEDFYAFPTYDTFLEVQWNRNQTGMLYQETSIISGDQQYFPHYFYGGKNTLSDLSWKDEGLRIMELKDENADNYFFFDLSNALADTQQFSIKLTSGGVLS
ncbi:MAG: hypothetical protein LBD75_02565 [Candidatus Peribacteria bacterium]|jgi:hypothetical protein|nr:hypothetical protein [Candidatus Peribacteria bacterium]